MERNAFLINKKIHQYILPGVLMTAAMQIGSVVDAMVAGSLLGTDAAAAVWISMPVLLLLQMPAVMLAKGGAAEAAALLAKGDMEKAGRVFSSTLAAGIAVSLIFALLTPFLPQALALALSGNEQLSVLAKPYIMVNFGGTPILTAAVIFCYFMNADNHPRLGSALLIIVNVVNLALDFVLIKAFHMGMAGSAFSTVTGYLTGMVTVVFYFRSKNRMLHLKKLDKKALQYTKSSEMAGIPSAAFTLMSALKSVIINSAIVRILGNESMAAYAVSINAILAARLCVGGITGLIPGIAGILYAERDYYGILTFCRKALVYSYAVIAVLTAAFLAAPQVIAGLFGITDGEMLSLCKTALRILACSLPFYVYNKFLTVYYQTVKKPGLSAVVTALWGFLVIVPFSLAGIFLRGLSGVCLMAAGSEVFTILASFLYRIWGQYKGRLEAGGVYMLPQINDEKSLDCSIKSSPEEVTALRERLFVFCAQNAVTERNARIVGLAVEEIAASIVQYGYQGCQRNDIDISFTIQDDKYILRIRDDGVPFNPLEYRGKEEEAAPGRIALLKKLMSDFRYMRALNMNNTVIELNIGRPYGCGTD